MIVGLVNWQLNAENATFTAVTTTTTILIARKAFGEIEKKNTRLAVSVRHFSLFFSFHLFEIENMQLNWNFTFFRWMIQLI